jgi:hypothetical protein
LIPLLLGLGVALFVGGLKARQSGQSYNKLVDGRMLRSKAWPGQQPLSGTSSAQSLPPAPLLALNPKQRRETAEQRAKEEVAQLTVAANLTSKQQGLATSVLENIQNSRIIVESLADAEERGARLAQLERLERKSLDAVIDAQQAPAVDKYFATRKRELQ